MEGLLFPIIMLAITLSSSGVFLLVMKHKKPQNRGSEENMAICTAQEFINVRDVKDRYLYTKDGMVLIFLRVHSISIDLYSKSEKHSLIRQLTAELSDIRYPFKFMAVSRPVDISPLIVDMQSMLKDAGDKQKELLRQEILQMSGYALSGEIVERQFYISLWENYEDGVEKDLFKRAVLLAEKFSGSGVGCDVLTEKEIIRLLNLVNNPSYTHLEDTEYNASVPTLKEDIYA